MNNVILQPCASPKAKQHFVKTIINGIPLSDILPYVDQQLAADLEKIYPDGKCFLWGTTPKNAGKWRRIKEGDILLFFASRKVDTIATVTYALHNPLLARMLWGLDEEDQAWEYIYFIDEVKGINISFDDLFPVIGYNNSNYIARSFQPLTDLQSKNFFGRFGRQSKLYSEPVSVHDLAKLEDQLTSLPETDAEYIGKRRLEQHILKKLLLDKRTVADCAICSKKYPSMFLVAAHIKRRSKCTQEQRKDLNVAVLMCKFGCDDLFEHGYIAVQNGTVVSLNKQPVTTEVQEKVAALTGKPCHYFTSARTEYFNWHFSDHTFNQA